MPHQLCVPREVPTPIAHHEVCPLPDSKTKDTPLCFYDKAMGVAQGSILSVSLFIVKINSVTSCIRNGVDKSLLVSYRSQHKP